MSAASTAREALIAEAIGDVAALIDRLEAVVPAIDAARRSLGETGTALDGQVTAFERRMAAITENAKVQGVKHIARRTEEMARASLDAQRRAMEEAARALFSAEIAPALQRLALPLQPMTATSVHYRWLTHAATAAVASAITWIVAAYLWAR